MQRPPHQAGQKYSYSIGQNSVFDMLWDSGESAPGEKTLPPSGGEWNT